MQRIAIDATWLPSDQRGMGRYVKAVVSYLLMRDDVVVSLLSRDANARAALEQRLGATSFGFAAWADVAREAERGALFWFPWNRIDFDPPGPAAVTIHDTAAFDWPLPGLMRAFDNRKAQGQLRQAAQRARRIMTVSQFSARCIMTHLGVPGGIIDVVSEGEHFSQMAPQPPPRPRPFVLWVGADDRRKNLPTLLEAWDILVGSSHFGGRDLVLVGIERPAEPTPYIEYISNCNDTTLAALYQHCDLFVYPSLYEGFGLPLLEAMACGAPVVASRDASLREVGGEVPHYYQPTTDGRALARAMAEVLNSPEESERMQAEGPLRAREFTWQRAADEVVASLLRLKEARSG